MRLLPKSLLLTLLGLLSLPAIGYASFHYMYPSNPDIVYTKHGKLSMVWNKFAEADTFTEYLAEKNNINEDDATVEVLVLRNYNEPQSDLHAHARLVYSSVVIHQVIHCRNRVVSIQDMMYFSQPFTKGMMVKDLYELDYDIGSAPEGSIDGKKVERLCSVSS
jgi:hypothetical protein